MPCSASHPLDLGGERRMIGPMELLRGARAISASSALAPSFVERLAVEVCQSGTSPVVFWPG